MLYIGTPRVVFIHLKLSSWIFGHEFEIKLEALLKTQKLSSVPVSWRTWGEDLSQEILSNAATIRIAAVFFEAD